MEFKENEPVGEQAMPTSIERCTLEEKSLGDLASHADVCKMLSGVSRRSVRRWRERDAATTGPKSSRSQLSEMEMQSKRRGGTTHGAPSSPNGTSGTSRRYSNSRESIWGKQRRSAEI